MPLSLTPALTRGSCRRPWSGASREIPGPELAHTQTLWVARQVVGFWHSELLTLLPQPMDP